ncbi:hypothetical protein Lesp02_84260 [Lentzea sp. NBRC 105346]|uniref:hypothetical protein n=1 Tax=Lentzea sp. NBRC 105346 TaxID=3032205 RepID=UPI0024A2DC60|nr:hypothetical protein [Lentzea sp. NBRC 105346]GLZ36239.1 hypothetical protein Lesp02_84260 [Lentzea sp. NBRC 105346]
MTATFPRHAGVVHIAGLDVEIGTLLRQRCAWCGEILADYDLRNVAAPIGQDPRPATWPVGGLVAVDGNLKTAVEHHAGDPLPANACLDRDAKQLTKKPGNHIDGTVHGTVVQAGRIGGTVHIR